MNESNFRKLLHKAIGDSDAPAHLSSQTRAALRQSVARQPARLGEGLVVIAALVVAVAVIAALLVPRMFTHVQQPVGVSSPSPSPLTPSPSPDPTACRIPVVVDDNHTRSSTLNLIAGFVEVATGHFTADQNVSFADLPYVPPQPAGGTLILATYDPAVRRWIPSWQWSPDQLSYLYVSYKPGSAALHIYNLVQHQDRIAWTTGYAIDTPFWRPDGIYVSFNYYGSDPRDVVRRDSQRFWIIDPDSGQANMVDEATFNPYAALITHPGPGGGAGGPDPERTLFRIGTRDPGTRYTDFAILDGKRVDIYSGVNGDQMDFDPYNVWFEGSRLWFSNFDSKYLWTWTAATSLVRYPIQIPNATGDPTRPVTYRVAGPCIT